MKKLFVLLLTVVLMAAGCGSEPEARELSIYMLTENEELVSVLRSFTKENPQISLKFEFGIEDTFKTPSEAKKELNTRLLAGDGPDIIILDDMNGEAYAKKGQLLDITDLAAERESSLLPNLQKDYQLQRKMYYMPLAISLISQAQTAGGRADFSTSKALVESIESQGLNIRNTSYDNLSALMYRIEMAPDIFKGDVVNQEKLREFYCTLADLMKLYGKEVDFASYEQTNLKVNHLRQYLRVAKGENDAAVDYVDTIFDAQSLYSLEGENQLSFQFVKEEGSYSYIPQGVIAISNQSSNKEEAEQMLRYLFSDKGQKKLLERDFIPVDLQVLEDSFLVEKQYDVNGEITIYPWTERSRRDFMEVVKNLGEPLFVDGNLMEIIMGGAQMYLNGEDTLQNALKTTVKKAEIYTTEQ